MKIISPNHTTNYQINESDITQEDKSYYNFIIKFVLFFLTAISIYLITNRPSHLPLQQAFLATSIIWCGFLPSILYLKKEIKPPFPFLPMFGIVYSIWFGFSAFNDEIIFSGGQIQINPLVFIFILTGMIVLYLSFYLSRNTIWKDVHFLKLPENFSLHRLRLILWSFLTLTFLSFFSAWIKQLGSIHVLIQPISYIAFGSFYILWNRGHLSAIESSVVFFILMPIQIIIFFSTGTLGNVFFFLLFLLFVYWYEKKRLPWVLIY